MRNKTNTSLGGDTIKLTISKVITMGISMITAMLLSRFRTLEEYGTYSQIMLVVNIMTSILMLGLPNSINYFLARTVIEEERRKFLSIYYTISTFLSIIVGVALICTTPLIVRYFNNQMLKNFVYVLAIYPWAIIIISGIENILIVYKRTSIMMIFRVANSISLLIIILIVQIFNWDFKAYMLLFVFVEAIFAISVYIIVSRISGRLKVVIDKQLIRNILSFSIPIGLASVVGTLNIELDKLMIGSYFDTAQLAIYTIASKEMPVTIVASSLTAVLLPQLVRLLKDGDSQKALDLWGSASILSYIIICFLAIGFFVFAPEVMTLLYSEKYLPGVSAFRVYTIVLLLRFTYFGMVLNAKGKTKFIFFSSLISLGLNIILNYVLFYSIGFIGPAIATFLSQFIINIIQLIFTAKTLNIKFQNIFPWKSLGIITAVNTFLGMLFYYLKIVISIQVITGEIFESILLAVVWGILYTIVFRKMIKEKWIKLNKGE